MNPERVQRIIQERQGGNQTGLISILEEIQSQYSHLPEEALKMVAAETGRSLVDVYGCGLLFTGSSAIGKSETALDLVERGHRLVADDVVTITRRHGDVLIGSGNQLLRHHMEIRGLGIIDVQTVFGIRSIRLQKRVEVEVNLREWSSSEDYERLGLDDRKSTFLDIEIPLVQVPITPGKNITVIAEVIALNYLVKVYGGYSPAERLNQHLIELMKRKSAARAWVREDTE